VSALESLWLSPTLILVPIFILQRKQRVENKNSTGLNTGEFKLLFNQAHEAHEESVAAPIPSLLF
jgi:hypothetical protein